ncbi:MAG: hypothetical protein RI894_2220 [Bacteroidota bacterium]|jgi:hypothetical protein
MNYLQLKGEMISRTDIGFDAAIMATLFNKRDYGRRPELMVIPKDVDDIIATVRYAKTVGLRVSICSGGHSWSANHLREGSILINMKGFNTFDLNKEAMAATAGPGVSGSVLLTELYKHNLFFPAGHCKGVCIGGYLLQGGFAWNGRKLGMACESVLGLDMVTADGELVHASATENADLYWAARGAGGGFFGVVVCFYLKLHPLPKYRGVIAHTFAIKYMDEVFNWAYEIGPSVLPAVEFQMVTARKTLHFFGTGTEASATIFADTKDEFEAAAAFMRNSPIKNKAFFRMPLIDLGIKIMYRGAMAHYPENHHWAVDNMWTRASATELLPHLTEIVASLPPAPAHLLWLNWCPPARPDMAFSVEDQTYLALYGCYKTAAETEKYGTWASEQVGKMAHLSTGIQLADEGLHLRSGRFLSDANRQKMSEIRYERDRNGLFNEWHSSPSNMKHEKHEVF